MPLGFYFAVAPSIFQTVMMRLSKIQGYYCARCAPMGKIGADWSTILPTNNDVTLQVNTIYHTEMVVNLGSSMVFDYVAHKKPCAYINYDIPKPKDKNWSVKKIYKFVHFRSMPHKNAVVWLNTKQEIAAKLEQTLATAATVPWAQKWFEKINQHPPQEASERIWNAITKIIQNKND